MPKLTLENPVAALDILFVLEDSQGTMRYAKPATVNVHPTTGAWELVFPDNDRILSNCNQWTRKNQYRPASWVAQGSLYWPAEHPERFGIVLEDETLGDYVERMQETKEHTSEITEDQWITIFAFQREKMVVAAEKAERQARVAAAQRAKRAEAYRQHMMYIK